MNELPTITTSGTSSNFYTLTGQGLGHATTTLNTGSLQDLYAYTEDKPTIQQTENTNNMATNRRIVQIYIADPNESVPLEKSLLYQDDAPHLTDLTDQELFFEIDIKNILDKHNEYRVTVKDKEASEGKNNDVMLEKAKIRDLKMTVVEIAKF